MYSRRYFGRVALGAIPLTMAAAKIDSLVHGIQFGLQSYVFYGVPNESTLDSVIKSMVDAGLGECDIFSPLMEPAELSSKARDPQSSPEARAQAREELSKWRTSVPLDCFQEIPSEVLRRGDRYIRL